MSNVWYDTCQVCAINPATCLVFDRNTSDPRTAWAACTTCGRTARRWGLHTEPLWFDNSIEPVFSRFEWVSLVALVLLVVGVLFYNLGWLQAISRTLRATLALVGI